MICWLMIMFFLFIITQSFQTIRYSIASITLLREHYSQLQLQVSNCKYLVFIHFLVGGKPVNSNTRLTHKLATYSQCVGVGKRERERE